MKKINRKLSIIFSKIIFACLLIAVFTLNAHNVLSKWASTILVVVIWILDSIFYKMVKARGKQDSGGVNEKVQ